MRGDFGTRIRRYIEKNYYSIWHNLKTVRLDVGESKDLKPERKEFYDIGLGTKCNAMCPWCYVSAKGDGEFWESPSETWKRWIETFPKDITITEEMMKGDPIFKELFYPAKDQTWDSLESVRLSKTLVLARLRKDPIVLTEKPFQIAIGSTMEPTIHPEFIKFLETVYSTGVVPNYTTNGITLAGEGNQELIEATREFCGGVAVSFGNTLIRDKARKAVENLLEYNEYKVMIHHLISDKTSVDEVVGLCKEYKGQVHYHVLLPLMKHGRSDKGMEDDGTYQYLAEMLEKEGIRNVAFGANFLPYMEKYPGLIKVYEYPSEMYSNNILLKGGKVVITPSSYNLNPIMEIPV